MRAVIICGGDIGDYGYIKKQIKESDFIICADSGYDHAVKMGVKTDLAVGDFDSARQIPQAAEVIRYSAEKDLTDTEIAVRHARSRGCGNFLLIAATGSRMDHTLANILLLKDCLDRGEYAEIINEHNKIMITNSDISLHEDIGAIVSLIPLSDCFGVTTENLGYPLYGSALPMGQGLGISNVMTRANARVYLREGIMLVIVAKD